MKGVKEYFLEHREEELKRRIEQLKTKEHEQSLFNYSRTKKPNQRD